MADRLERQRYRGIVTRSMSSTRSYSESRASLRSRSRERSSSFSAVSSYGVVTHESSGPIPTGSIDHDDKDRKIQNSSYMELEEVLSESESSRNSPKLNFGPGEAANLAAISDSGYPTKNEERSFLSYILSKRRTAFISGVLLSLAIVSLVTFLSPDSSSKESITPAAAWNWTSRLWEQLKLEKLGRDYQLLDFNSQTEPPGVSMRRRGLKAHYPVILIPGIVSTSLESWARGGCADSYFRRKIWGDLSMATSLILDKHCWLKNLMLDPDTGLDPMRKNVSSDGPFWKSSDEEAKLRAVSGIDAADYFVQGYWVWSRLIDNLAIIGYDSNNMHLAAYDWRLSFPNLEKRDHHLTKLKNKIELNLKLTGKKTVLISHSMGGNLVEYFMKWAEANAGEGWVDKHLHAFVSIATPFLGAPKTLSALLSGESKDTAQMGWAMAQLLERVFTKKERASLFRTWGGVASMIPKGGDLIWGNLTWAPDADDYIGSNGEAILPLGKMISFNQASKQLGDFFRVLNLGEVRNLTAHEANHFVLDRLGDKFKNRITQDYSFGIKLSDLKHYESNHSRYWVNPLESALPEAPEFTIYAFYGTGKPVERSYFYALPEESIKKAKAIVDGVKDANTSKTEFPVFSDLFVDTDVTDTDIGLENGVQAVNGDGTVPLLSLGYMPYAGWRHKTPEDNSSDKKYGHIFNPGKVKTVVREYKHSPVALVRDVRGGPDTGDHVDILGNYEMTVDILKIVSGNQDQEVEERIYSNLKKISSRIELQNLDVT